MSTPEWLLSSSDAPESIQKSQATSDKDKIIAVQEELIKSLQKQVLAQSHYIQALWNKFEEATARSNTPDKTIKKLFDLVDQSGSYMALEKEVKAGGFDEIDEGHKWLQFLK